MRSPDEIKKGLECCHRYGSCDGCPYVLTLKSGFGDELGCDDSLLPDALDYIQQLEAANAELLTNVEQLEAKCHQQEEKNAAYEQSTSKCCYESRCNAQVKELEALCGRLMDEKEQLERERDAAVADFKAIDRPCNVCKHLEKSASETPCNSCIHVLKGEKSRFEWRGVKEN